MHVLKARVEKGRLKLDEPTELPDGTEVELLLAIDEGDELDEEERKLLHASIARGVADARAGRDTDSEEFS